MLNGAFVLYVKLFTFYFLSTFVAYYCWLVIQSATFTTRWRRKVVYAKQNRQVFSYHFVLLTGSRHSVGELLSRNLASRVTT